MSTRNLSFRRTLVRRRRHDSAAKTVLHSVSLLQEILLWLPPGEMLRLQALWGKRNCFRVRAALFLEAESARRLRRLVAPNGYPRRAVPIVSRQQRDELHLELWSDGHDRNPETPVLVNPLWWKILDAAKHDHARGVTHWGTSWRRMLFVQPAVRVVRFRCLECTLRQQPGKNFFAECTEERDWVKHEIRAVDNGGVTMGQMQDLAMVPEHSRPMAYNHMLHFRCEGREMMHQPFLGGYRTGHDVLAKFWEIHHMKRSDGSWVPRS